MTEQIDQHLTANVKLRKKDIIISNFLGGLAWGFGTVVGATVVVACLVGLLKTINFVPIVGQFVSGVVEVVNQNQPPSLRR